MTYDKRVRKARLKIEEPKAKQKANSFLKQKKGSKKQKAAELHPQTTS